MTLESRKHSLTLDGNVVIKAYDDDISFNNESSILLHCSEVGLLVPVVYSVSNHEIKMEYVEGVLYSELLNNINEPQILSLCDWLYKFHQTFNNPRGDMNLHNFIWTENGCCAIDFADSLQYENIEHDIGSLLAFLIVNQIEKNINLEDSCKLIINYFVDKSYSFDDIEKGFFDEIQQMIVRKKKYKNIEFKNAGRMHEIWNAIND